MWNVRLVESHVAIKIARRNINLRYADSTIPIAESEEELKSLLMWVKEECEKPGLKLNIQKTHQGICPITSWQIDGRKLETVTDFIFLGSKKTLAAWKEGCDKPRQCIKKLRHQFADKGLYSQSYSFSSSHVWMWELNHKESWVLKNWCFWVVGLEKILESPLDCKMKPVKPKGNQPWIGKTNAEVAILRPCDTKSQRTARDPDAGKEGRRRSGRRRMR